MARAGFTAIWAGQIRFGRDGRWYCDGEAITNRAICRLYSRAMTVAPDGRGRLELGDDKAWVEIEDTPWVVTQIDGDPTRGFTLHLNDESTEPLDPSTLAVGAGHVLYARAKGGHRVRFLRNAYYTLARWADVGANGEIVLSVQGRIIPLGIGST
jgi:hypothetical protein